MAQTENSGGRGSQKCKTGEEPSEPAPFRQGWCGDFLAYALKTADIEAACRVCEVGLGEYLTARRTDPAFELACLELDLIVRASAVAVLEAAAARGEANVGKLKLLMAGLEQLRMVAGDGPETDGFRSPPGAPKFLETMLGKICSGKNFNLVVYHAVSVAYRAAVKFVEDNPGVSHWNFTFPGPCEDCLDGLALICPNPRCAKRLLVKNNSDRPKPNGFVWKDYQIVQGVTIDVIERRSAVVASHLHRIVEESLGEIQEGEE